MEIGAIYEGDNLEVLSKFPSESVDLVYLDPPFFSNKQYEVLWKDGAELRAFQDRWKGGIEHYITWMEPRLRECHRVLKNTGSIYLHCDWHANAHLRILMDKIFGEKNFRNEIIWHYKSFHGQVKNYFPKKHDTLFFYTKGKKWTFKQQYDLDNEGTIDYKRWNKYLVEGYKILGKNMPMQDTRFVRFYNRWVKENERKPKPDDVVYEVIGQALDSVWDIKPVDPKSMERLGYPTQKPVELLKRIITASSKEGDIILDPFCGCGTTLSASQKLKRRWIGIDVSPTACKVMSKRFRQEFSISPQLIRGNVDLKYVKKLQPFDFQNWVIVDKFLGNVSRTKSGDFGVDGFTPQIMGGFPIQVKQSEDIGRNVIDNFQSAMRRFNKKKGYIVAFSFGRGAREEVAKLKNQGDIHIILRTVEELLEGKIEE